MTMAVEHGAAGEIARDSVQITGHGSLFRLIRLRTANQEHEDFLCDLFSRRGIAAHVQHETVNRTLVAFVEGPKRNLVSLGELPEQLLIFGRRICHCRTRRFCLGSYLPLHELGKMFQNSSPKTS